MERPFSGGLPGRLASLGFSTGRFGLPCLPVSTAPRPWNSPGRGVAATSGRPWFTEASKVRLLLAAC